MPVASGLFAFLAEAYTRTTLPGECPMKLIQALALLLGGDRRMWSGRMRVLLETRTGPPVPDDGCQAGVLSAPAGGTSRPRPSDKQKAVSHTFC